MYKNTGNFVYMYNLLIGKKICNLL